MYTHILVQTEVYDQSECNVHTILVQTEVYDQSECNAHTHPGAD